MAARYGKLDVFRFVTEIGANINICDVQINTVLLNAAFSVGEEIIKSFLDNGMSVDLPNEDDSTSLHVSAPYGNLDATKIFLKKCTFRQN